MSYPEETSWNQILLHWYDEHKRTLTFRGTRDPYRIWISEIMLQQTRTETVGAYYERFLQRFPDVFELANASEQEVLKSWEGLGYYSRARNLHRAAQMLVEKYRGVFPKTIEELQTLPGIGSYTAAAVASIAFDIPVPAMDGNLTRVFSRIYGVREDVGIPSVKRKLFQLACQAMPLKRCGDFNQALMDLGAGICISGTPTCESCPLCAYCNAFEEGDADLLPMRSVAKPPKIIEMAVLIVFHKGKIWMVQRKEALLHGLWVFPLFEEFHSIDDVIEYYRASKKAVSSVRYLGEARHIFTHRVWNMRIYSCVVPSSEIADGKWVSIDEMEQLPIPTAMRVAKSMARETYQRFANLK